MVWGEKVGGCEEESSEAEEDEGGDAEEAYEEGHGGSGAVDVDLGGVHGSWEGKVVLVPMLDVYGGGGGSSYEFLLWRRHRCLRGVW